MAQSEIPVMFDSFGVSDSDWAIGWTDPNDASAATRFNHIPGGCNVLWMDGHVEFQRYGKNFPIGWSIPDPNIADPDAQLGRILPLLVSQASGFG